MRAGLIATYFDVCALSTLADLCTALRFLLGTCVEAYSSATPGWATASPLVEGFALLSTTTTAVLSQLASHDSPAALCSAILALLHTAEATGLSVYAAHT